jgi:hypothetical protein
LSKEVDWNYQVRKFRFCLNYLFQEYVYKAIVVCRQLLIAANVIELCKRNGYLHTTTDKYFAMNQLTV